MSKDDRELVERLSEALDFDAQAGTDEQWSRLMAEAMNARTRLEALQAQPVGEESGWLIEENASGIIHWIALAENEWPRTEIHVRRARSGRDMMVETDKYRSPVVRVKDANEALRFARKEDAEALIKLFDRFLLCPLATEHVWHAAALTASPPVVEREAIARWKATLETKTDADFLTEYRISAEDLRAILALTPVEGVGERPEPFGYWVEQKHADPVLLRKPAYIPEPSDLRTVTPLYSTPVAQGDEVRDALEATAEALENVLSADPDMPTYQADYDAAEQQLERAKAALATLTKGARDAG